MPWRLSHLDSQDGVALPFLNPTLHHESFRAAVSTSWHRCSLLTSLKHGAVKLLPRAGLPIVLSAESFVSGRVGVCMCFIDLTGLVGWGGGASESLRDSGHPSWAKIIPSGSQALLSIRVTRGDVKFPQVQTAAHTS